MFRFRFTRSEIFERSLKCILIVFVIDLVGLFIQLLVKNCINMKKAEIMKREQLLIS